MAGVPYCAPLWVRALLTWDRIAIRMNSVRQSILDEALLAWVRPEDRVALTATLYADQDTYLPGGVRFQSGLFPWEASALDSPLFPRCGRILLGACGAGRELVALLDRGFSVVAFDPCLRFADAARRVARGAGATVVHASYADLVRAAHGRVGPLAFVRAGPPFDAIVLGWGSFSHVMPSAERQSLLSALRLLGPRAPVLMSFALEPSPGSVPPGKGRIRGALKCLFAALGAPGVSEAGDHFLTNGGFFSLLTRDELVKLAFATGYEVVLLEDLPYAHAILIPLGAEGARTPDTKQGG
jgi:hypothetical protein